MAFLSCSAGRELSLSADLPFCTPKQFPIPHFTHKQFYTHTTRACPPFPCAAAWQEPELCRRVEAVLERARLEFRWRA